MSGKTFALCTTVAALTRDPSYCDVERQHRFRLFAFLDQTCLGILHIQCLSLRTTAYSSIAMRNLTEYSCYYMNAQVTISIMLGWSTVDVMRRVTRWLGYDYDRRPLIRGVTRRYKRHAAGRSTSR
jgi:hypothetical protein